MSAGGGGVNPSSLIKPKFTGSSNHQEKVTIWSPSDLLVVTKLSTSDHQAVTKTKSNNSFPKMVIFRTFVIKMSRVALRTLVGNQTTNVRI